MSHEKEDTVVIVRRCEHGYRCLMHRQGPTGMVLTAAEVYELRVMFPGGVTVLDRFGEEVRDERKIETLRPAPLAISSSAPEVCPNDETEKAGGETETEAGWETL